MILSYIVIVLYTQYKNTQFAPVYIDITTPFSMLILKLYGSILPLKQRPDIIGPVTPIKYTDPNVSEPNRIEFSNILYNKVYNKVNINYININYKK